MTQNRPTIIIPAFNKPDLLKEVFERIKAQTVLPENIEVFIDQPKNENFINENKEVIRLAQSFKIDGAKININIREKHYGCEENILGAIHDVLKTSETIVLIEDDILVNPFFYESMCKMLEYFLDDDEILTVRGISLAKLESKRNNDVHITDYFACWGMGTWRKKWLPFYNEVSANKIISINYIKKLTKTNYHTIKGHYTYNSGASEDWGNLLGAHCLKKGLYQIEPNKSLAENVGGGHPGANISVHQDHSINASFSNDYRVENIHCINEKNLYTKENSYTFIEKSKKLAYIYFKNFICFLLVNSIGVKKTKFLIRICREKNLI